MSAVAAASARRRPAGPLVVAGVIAAAAIVLAGAAAVWGRGGPAAFRGTAVLPREPAPEIALVDQDRRLFRLSGLRGSPVVLFFGYTSCPDVCPTTLGDLARSVRLLGDDASRVRVLMVTVDPKTDTPEQLKRYLAQFDPSFTGLTGPGDDIERVVARYGAYVKEQPGSEGGPVDLRHSAVTYLVDRAGRLAVVHPYGAAPDAIASDLRRLLAE